MFHLAELPAMSGWKNDDDLEYSDIGTTSSNEYSDTGTTSLRRSRWGSSSQDVPAGVQENADFSAELFSDDILLGLQGIPQREAQPNPQSDIQPPLLDKMLANAAPQRDAEPSGAATPDASPTTAGSTGLSTTTIIIIAISGAVGLILVILAALFIFRGKRGGRRTASMGSRTTTSSASLLVTPPKMDQKSMTFGIPSGQPPAKKSGGWFGTGGRSYGTATRTSTPEAAPMSAGDVASYIKEGSTVPSVVSTKYRVSYPYAKALTDEINLQAGDVVEVMAMYDDGWCRVKNLRTDEIGTAPFACLAPIL
ncbi:hypothetical protein HDU96_009803 [Phlyctochytrium bullatum]|nr:hypothetical protein HDU96_009803 [Phlyctochytrium bullatum]